MVCNDVGLKSPTHRSFKFWYRDFCSSLRAIAKQFRKTVITRSEKRRSNLIHIEKDEIATFRCTPLAMTDNRLRNKCAMTSVGDMKENNFFDKVHSLFTSHFSLKSAAFTLAEVLVTLGIIGVVSAMTVPTLMQNYQRQSYVTQLHKTYNEFSQAILRFQTDRNAVNLTEAGLTSQEVCNNLMTSYFKTTQTCENSLTPCFADSYKTLQGGTIDFNINTSYVLASGASVRFMYAQVGNGINKIANITVDVNGKKGPNILGRDLFWMALYNDGVIDDYDYKSPAPLSESLRNDAYDTYCQGSGVVPGYGCFGRILNNNWEMNY